ncbi:MAG: HAMP domain-containing sensor histidine kinase [Chloroflexota bacterium]
MSSPQDRRTLLQNVGHKISTPLTDIMQLADTILYGAEGEVSPLVRENISQMRGAAEGVLAIAEKLLGLVSIDSLPQEHSVIEIAYAIQRVYNEVQPLANTLHRQLVLDMEDDLTLLDANSDYLQQALHILLTTMIRLAHNDTIHIIVRAAERFVIVSVQDGQSAAIPHEVPIRDFLRAHPDSELGLDLLICQRIAEVHNGNLWLTSGQELANSTWHISWPIANN